MERYAGEAAAPGRSGPGADGAAGAGAAAPDGPARDSQAVGAFVERFAAVLTDSGIPRMPSRIFAALLTSDTSRLTAAEIAATLRVSPAAVSGGVRYLTHVGLVSRESRPGSRQHVYRVPDSVWHELVSIRDRLLLRWAAVMREGAAALGPATGAGARLAESALYFEFISAELPALADRWAEYKAAHQG